MMSFCLRLAFAAIDPTFLRETEQASGRVVLAILGDIVMYAARIPFSFRNDTMIAAVVAAMALIVAAPSVATAGTATRHLGKATSTTTDISAARRHHHAHHRSIAARAAYGSFISGPGYGYPYGSGGYPGYGYGVGDNDRNQTW